MLAMNRILFLGALLAAALLPATALAQSNYDTSGNSLVQGNYFIRQVMNAKLTNLGQIGQAASLTGTISFGAYSMVPRIPKSRSPLQCKQNPLFLFWLVGRSEERRVGEEGR